jgi:hypothetical protein
MSGKRGRLFPVLAAAAILVGGANFAAYAASGHPLVLGGGNHAAGTTTLHNDGRGPALSLRTRPGAAPLAVSSHHKVKELNADQVDGFTSRSLRTRSWTYRIGGDSDEGPTIVRTFPGLPAGHYLASYNMVAGLYASGYAMSCWFTTPSQARAVYGRAMQDPGGPVVVGASGYVDATGPISMTCQAAPAFDTYSSAESSYDSQVTFTMLDTSSLRWAAAGARTARSR